MTGLPGGHAMEVIDVRTAPGEALRAMFAVATTIEREDVPEPPWVPEAEWVAELRADAGIQDRSDRLVRGPDGDPIGVGHFWATRSEENRHRAKLVVQVVPAARRRGIGTHLLAEVALAALDAGRTRVQTWTTTAGPGAAFAERWGVVTEDELELNRLRTAGLDRAQLDAWVARAGERAAGYELVTWGGPCPDGLRIAFAAARQVMDTAPQTSDHVDEVFTVDKLDELEASWVESGVPWSTVVARHVASGTIAGFTELAYSEDEPSLCYQGETAVDPDHRGLGLGRWLKATLLLRTLAERPEVEVIDTYNAGSNDAMIAINRDLGFRVILRTERRQGDLAEVVARLTDHRASATDPV